MEYQYWQFEGERWICRKLTNHVWLLEPEEKQNSLVKIHNLTEGIQKLYPDIISDFVPAYNSLGIVLENSALELSEVLEKIEKPETEDSLKITKYEIPVYYDLGLDWEELERRTELPKVEIIDIHSGTEYTIAMLGFLPGFVFLEGLDERLYVPRKKNPRTKIPAGSVAIGGHQTGLYSLESPGGWQIIGRTPQSFFDVQNNPPTTLKAGDKVRFIPISLKKFEEYQS